MRSPTSRARRRRSARRAHRRAAARTCAARSWPSPSGAMRARARSTSRSSILSTRHVADEFAFPPEERVRSFAGHACRDRRGARADRPGRILVKVIVRKIRAAGRAATPAAARRAVRRSRSCEGVARVEGVVGGRSVATSADVRDHRGARRARHRRGDGSKARRRHVDATITDEPVAAARRLRGCRAPRRCRASGRPSPSRRTSRACLRRRRAARFRPKRRSRPFADIDGVLDASTRRARATKSSTASSWDEHGRAPRGAFAVKKGGFRGIACNSDLGEARRVSRNRDPHRRADACSASPRRRARTSGPLPATPPHEALLRFMHGTSGEVRGRARERRGPPRGHPLRRRARRHDDRDPPGRGARTQKRAAPSRAS